MACHGIWASRAKKRCLLISPSTPAQAAAMWTTVDHRLADQAEWVTTVDLNEVDIISSGLRNYEFNPVNGFIADQAVVRG